MYVPKNSSESVKIKKTSASDQVVTIMKELIKSGEWKIDEKTPSEAELSEMFGVNRLTVRMALQKLNTLGMLDTRVGDGTYVCKFSLKKYIADAASLYMKPELLDDICEFRKIIEIEALRLAIERGQPNEFEELSKIALDFSALNKMLFDDANFNENQIEELASLDLDFHYKICKMSHNSLLAHSFIIAKDTLKVYLKTIISTRLQRNIQRNISTDITIYGHNKICDKMIARDFDGAKKIYLDMIDHKVDFI